MKLTVCFGQVKVIVPCGDGDLTVKELIEKATSRYVKASLQVRFNGFQRLSTLSKPCSKLDFKCYIIYMPVHLFLATYLISVFPLMVVWSDT